ncbi:hypothetical protein Ae707Ps1_4025 [Pseudonocardia sp. Ae707_Ps1]|nr:hypothetical protein Ae707Ps1_4025 [Pseudonocardia sp. Ae707_Ps1]
MAVDTTADARKDWPVLTPAGRTARWLQRLVLVALTIVGLIGIVVAPPGLGPGRTALAGAGLLVLVLAVAVVWPLAGSWPGRVANPSTVWSSRWRDRWAARRDLVAGRPLDDDARRHVAASVATWSANVLQLPVLCGIIGYQLVLQATRPDSGRFLDGVVVVTVLVVGVTVVTLLRGLSLRRAARAAGALPEVRSGP